MRKLRNRRRLGCLAVLVLLAGGGATASSPRPFKVMLEGLANPTFINDCTVLNTETGSGHATSIGRISWQSSETVDTCSNPDAAQIKGEFVLTDRTGDQLVGTYNTVAHFGEGLLAAGLYRITGGTGKFANASGEGLISAEGALAPPFPFAGELSGTISF